MTEPTPEEPDRRFVELNWLGKAVFVAGVSVRLSARLIDSVVATAAKTYLEAEKAFKQGIDPMIEEAEVIAEGRESDDSHQDHETTGSS